MEKDKEETRVIFAVWLPQPETNDPGGTVIALFPDTAYRGQVNSYEHVGQHAPAEYPALLRRTRPATVEEAAPLARELESGHGYRLKDITKR